MKGRRDREYDRMLAVVSGKQEGDLVPDAPADIGAVLEDVNKLLHVDVQKERLQKALQEAKAKLRDAEAELGVIRPQAEALSRKVLDLHRLVEDLANTNKLLLAEMKEPDRSAAEVRYAEGRQRHAEGRMGTAELAAAESDRHARASEERAAKAEALVKHAQQHARDAEAAIEDAEARAKKAHAEGLKEGTTIIKYAMAAAKQMLAAKNAGRIKAMTDDPTGDFAYLVRKAMQIEDRVREELTRKDGE